MSMIGEIVWRDITVPNAEELRDYYCDVVGWNWEKHPDCDDFNISVPTTGETVTGVCYAKGVNQDIPAQWLTYVWVESVVSSIAKAVARGGKVVHGPRLMAGSSFAVIQDPAGAFLAIMSAKEELAV